MFEDLIAFRLFKDFSFSFSSNYVMNWNWKKLKMFFWIADNANIKINNYFADFQKQSFEAGVHFQFISDSSRG